MKMKLSVKKGENVIYQNRYPDNFVEKQDIQEADVEINLNNTRLHISEMWFEGIHISWVELDTEEKEDLFFEYTYQHIGFLFCLTGSLIPDTGSGTNVSPLAKNQQHIILGKMDDIAFTVNEKTSFIYIQLTEGYFQKTIGREFLHDSFSSLNGPVLPEISLILQQIMQQKHSGRLKRLFLEARILDLIVIYSNQKPQKQAVILKEEDVNKIIYAKQLVEHDLQNPNSLIELSRKAGINDYKLKKGFKALTGHTVFGYLYKIRMEKAHYFLSEEKKTVNEVAFLVGYKNAQHFIAAFKKQYQILPGSLNKH